MKDETALGYAILGLLHQAPRSGYDLRKIFTLTPFSHFSDSPGAVYPALARLRRRRWVSPSAPDGGRGRRTFHLTAVGRRAWVVWLRRRPTRADVVWYLDQLMVRFAFMAEAVPTSVAVRFLEALERQVDAHIAALRRFREGAAFGMTTTGRLAFDGGVEAYEARAAWARRSRALLTRKGGAS